MTPQTESKSILDNPTVLERGIIYARVSTDEQAESGTSIDNQIAKGLAYAEAAGLHVPPEFIFREDFTGTTLDRPELIKVRAMLKSGQADNLIVYNNTRLDRSKFGRDTLVLFSEWFDLGVSVHFSETRQRVNLNDPLQVLLYGSFGGWNAGNDRDATVKKLADGRQSRAEQGFVVPMGAGAPYGYRAVKGTDKRWHFEIYEPEAEIVKLIFHWYIFGDENGKPLTGQGITDKLTEMGIATWGDKREKSAKRRTAGEWSRDTINKILQNETYCGTWYYGKKRKPGTKNNPIAVAVPEIISRDIWKAAQKRLEYNKQMSSRNKKREYLLSGRCTCFYCGYKMTGLTSGAVGIRYYGCPSGNKRKWADTRHCNNLNYRADVADQVVWDYIEEIITNEEMLKAGLLAYQDQQEEVVSPVKAELAIVIGLIEKHESELNELLTTMKLLTSPRAKANIALDIERIEGTLDELEKRRGSLQEKLETKSLTDEQIMSLVQFAKMVAADLETVRSKPEAKRKVLELLNVQVTFFADDLEKRGARKAGRKVKATIQLCAMSKTLLVETGCTNLTLLQFVAIASTNNGGEYWTISQVLPLD